MLALIGSWAALVAAVVAVAFYRKWIAREEDDTIHLSEVQTEVVKHQLVTEKRLERVDGIGKVLTVALILYTLAVVGRIVYLGWLDSAQMK
jgi:H+/gluconate symporter-like permease